MEGRLFEDLDLGERFDCGSTVVEREDVIEFAERYDPQPFHVDEQAAQEYPYGGLIASGWQTVCLTCKLYIEGCMDDIAGLGGPECKSIKFPRPVHPGDTLSVTTEIADKSLPSPGMERGFVDFDITTRNQHNQEVLSMTPVQMIKSENAGD